MVEPLKWASVPGQTYRVYRRDALDKPWRMIAAQVQAQGGITTWSGSASAPGTMGFFAVSNCAE